MVTLPISLSFLMSHPAVYRIRVSGRLDPTWSQSMLGMTLTVIETPDQGILTELTGRLADQAALMGVLDQLYNRNIPLLRVECISYEPEAFT